MTLEAGGKGTSMKTKLLCILVLLSATGLAARGQDISSMNIEQLLQVEVTSVTKTSEPLARSAAAVYVITQEDIRRSGATDIPDLLRMVPGLDVARVNGSSWAISSRGFNEQVANKLLVLIDGRTVYSPLFSGVFWDAQEIPLELIDRIEVIRGPGATMWGANAVNGVINIITKKASEAQGTLISGGGGTYEQGFGFAQFGGKFGSDSHYRIFTGDFNRGALLSPSGQSGRDAWDAYRIGFRADGRLSDNDSLTLEGDGYMGSEGEMVNTITSISPPANQTLNFNEDFAGWDILSRWTHTSSPGSETSLQVYFDRTNREDPTYSEGRSTVDIDFQHHIGWGDRQDIVWGAGYRRTSDNILGSLRVSFNPASEANQLFSWFAQDEIAISPDHWYLTTGVKLEHNDFSGFGVQPSARIAWLANNKNMFWASVSRALRTPARDVQVRFNEMALPGPGGVSILVAAIGVQQLDETLLATETGFRTELNPRTSLDLAAFYNSYGDLASGELGNLFPEQNPAPPHLVAPIYGGNALHGETHGIEFAANWLLTHHWTISPGYSYEQIHIYKTATSTDTTSIGSIEGSSPREQAQLRSHLEINRQLKWDASAYFVGRLTGIPSYTRLDSGVTWQPLKQFSLSFIGQNLLKGQHLEFNNSEEIVNSSLVKRSAYAKFSLQF